MTIFLIIIVGLVAFIVAYFFVLGQMSKSGSPPGLAGGQLAKCSAKPNCVCSEYSGDPVHAIAPIDIAGIETGVALEKIKEIMQSMGGEAQTERNHYLAYTFSSTLFGFVDDVEVRIDPEKNALHLRSASRVGYSDMGINRKRVELIKETFNAQNTNQ